MHDHFLRGVCYLVDPIVESGSKEEQRIIELIKWYCSTQRLPRPASWPPYAKLDDRARQIERLVLQTFIGENERYRLRESAAVAQRVRKGADAAGLTYVVETVDREARTIVRRKKVNKES